MKKITAIVLLCVYSLSTLGLSLKSFYCCGKLESVTVSISQQQQKSYSNGDGKSDCCRTKYRFFKVKDNHLAADILSISGLSYTHLHLLPVAFQVIHEPREIYFTSLINAPPLFQTVPGYILNGVIRI